MSEARIVPDWIASLSLGLSTTTIILIRSLSRFFLQQIEAFNETDKVRELDCYCVRQAKPDHLASVGGQVFLFLGFR